MGAVIEADSDEGVADSNIEARLRILCDLPGPDAALLARLIAGIAKTDLAGCRKDWGEERRNARRALLPKLKRLHAAAVDVVHLGSEFEPQVAADAVGDLIRSTSGPDGKTVGDELLQLARRLETFHPTALPGVSSGPRVNEQMVLIVQAVAAYFLRKGKPFTGAPRRTETDRGPEHIIKSEQARLTLSVLNIMGFKVLPPRLGTLMRKARAAETLRASTKL